MIDESRRTVFFGGAGVSTESGIPDFRSVDGLYNQKFDYPPETILSHSFFVSHTAEFYDFYRNNLLKKPPMGGFLRFIAWLFGYSVSDGAFPGCHPAFECKCYPG